MLALFLSLPGDPSTETGFQIKDLGWATPLTPGP